MVVIPSGRVILARAGQLRNVLLLIIVRLFERVTKARDVQLLKAPLPTEFTESGITIFASDEQFLNASLPIDFTDALIVTLASDEHPEKAESPIVTTFAGILIFASEEQPLNAPSPMAITVSAIVAEVTLSKTEKA